MTSPTSIIHCERPVSIVSDVTQLRTGLTLVTTCTEFLPRQHERLRSNHQSIVHTLLTREGSLDRTPPFACSPSQNQCTQIPPPSPPNPIWRRSTTVATPTSPTPVLPYMRNMTARRPERAARNLARGKQDKLPAHARAYRASHRIASATAHASRDVFAYVMSCRSEATDIALPPPIPPMPRDGRAGMARAWRDWWLKRTQQMYYMGIATLCDHPCSLSCRALNDYHEGGECAGPDVPNCRQCAQDDRTRTLELSKSRPSSNMDAV